MTRQRKIAAMASVEGVPVSDWLNLAQDRGMVSSECVTLDEVPNCDIDRAFAGYGFRVGEFVKQWGREQKKAA